MTQGSVDLIASLIILASALLLDLAVGEPPAKVHPTVWMGKAIALLEPKARGGGPRAERLKGALLALLTIALFAIPVHLALLFVRHQLGLAAYIVLAAALLKPTFAVKCMSDFAVPIARAVRQGRLDEARQLLRHIVRRDTTKLNEQQVLSAAVESIAEGTVDGATSPLLYFALLGVPGAISFRAINTLDSMVGYKDPVHVHVGWFSARLDTLANYVPARLTALLMVVAARLLGEDWRNARRIMRRDSGKTESLNAGWSMSAMAGALRVRLEKPGHYALGDDLEALTPDHVLRALRVMKLTTLLFAALVATPLLALTTMLIG
jgi:adenosylcobinamide-phosphate synthase